MFLDTSTPVCILKLDSKEYRFEAGNMLAEGIFRFIKEKLSENSKDWKDLSEIHYYSGPGSFTGLRIGAAVVNTLADQLKIPLFDHNNNRKQIILPDYGRPARITTPKK